MSEGKARQGATRSEVERLLAWMDAPGVGVSLRDPEGRFLLAGPGVAAMLGADVVGRRAEDVLDPLTAAAVRARDAETILTGAGRQGEETLHTAAGVVRVAASRFPVYGDDGAAIGVACVWQRLAPDADGGAERVARESEARFRVAFEEAPYVMSISDLDGRIVQANRAGAAILGYTPEEMIGRTYADLVHPDDRPQVEGLRRGFAVGERDASRIVRRRLVHRDGHVVYYEAVGSLVRDPDGTPLYVLSQGRDITAQIEAEQRLEDSLALFRIAFEHAPHAMILSDVEGRFLRVNPAFCRMLGRDADELVGRTVVDVTHPDDVQISLEARARLKADRTMRTRKRYLHRDGRVVWGEIHATVVQDKAGNPIYHIVQVRDVTEELRLEVERRELGEQLRRSQQLESVGRLAGGIAHDFNNMLAVILTSTDMALRRARNADPRLRDCLEQVHSAASRSAALTRQLLILGRRDYVRARRLSLVDAVRDFAKLLQRTLGEDVAMTLQLDPSTPEVEIALPHVEQLLLNLAVNARDAMPQGGRLTIRTEGCTLLGPRGRLGPGNYARLVVTDTGVGMSSDVLALAFEPFFTTKEVGKGTGLGLSIVFGIVDAAHGAIHADSEPGQGTVFEILLPACVPSAHAADAPVAAAPRPRGRGERVLLVEDEPALLDLTAQTLRENGYTVLAAARAEDALSVCRDRAPDLVIADVVLPGMSGPALAEKLRAAWPGLRVLLMSGHGDDRIAAHDECGRGAGMLSKPFDTATLLAAVQEVFAAGDGAA